MSAECSLRGEELGGAGLLDQGTEARAGAVRGAAGSARRRRGRGVGRVARERLDGPLMALVRHGVVRHVVGGGHGVRSCAGGATGEPGREVPQVVPVAAEDTGPAGA